VVVDHGVSERPVEPGDHRLLVAHGPRALHPLDERLLEDVLSLGSAADAPLQEAKELAMVAHQFLDDGGGRR
jgi:hypothetical protein